MSLHTTDGRAYAWREPLTEADLTAMAQRNWMPCPYVHTGPGHHVCVCNNTMRIPRSTDLATLLAAYGALRSPALPPNWTVETARDADARVMGYRLWESPLDTPTSSYERVHITLHGIRVWTMPRHWPAIPPPVMLHATTLFLALQELQ